MLKYCFNIREKVNFIQNILLLKCIRYSHKNLTGKIVHYIYLTYIKNQTALIALLAIALVITNKI